MKNAFFLLVFCFAVIARADLTMVQTVEGVGGAPSQVTIKIKDNMARIDSNPTMSTIVNGKNGEVLNLLLDQKKIVRISADKMKAVVEMVDKYAPTDRKTGANKPNLVATGKKEKIGGYDAEEYVYDSPHLKATYWIAPQYPNGAAILAQLKTLNPKMWAANGMNLPDYNAFNGVPIKTVISAGGSDIVTTLVSVKQDPIDPAQFVPPKDFEEVKVPDLGKLLQGGR